MKRGLRLVIFLVGIVLFFPDCGGLDQGLNDPATITPPERVVGDGGVKNVAISGAGGDVAVDAGYATNGTFIDIPDGFTAAQCKFTAAAAQIDSSVISTLVSINSTTGEVICEEIARTQSDSPPETKGCVASYTVLCVK